MTNGIESETAEMREFCERVEKAAKARDELEVFGTAYMPLPLDADGVPIRVGDKLNYIDPFGNVFLCTVQPLLSHNPKCYRHVKPRTLEDVLFEFGEEFEGEMDGIAPIIAKYAEEIRVMFGEVD